MTGRTFNLASLVSVVVCALLLTLWLATTSRPLAFEIGRQDRRWDVRSSSGLLIVGNRPQILADLRSYQAAFDDFSRQRRDLAAARRETTERYANARYGSPEWQQFLAAEQQYIDDNFKLAAPPRNIRPSVTYFLRHRTPVILTAILPAAWLIGCVRRRVEARHSLRQRLHLCRSCGYDLRATPDRCPECGAFP